MYISTCISNKSCHRHSYGFQNLMSSWGVAPMKIKILMGIWIFWILSTKVILGGILRKNLPLPTFSLRGPALCLKWPEGPPRARQREFDGVGWGWLTKVSFNFLHTLWIYRLCIYLLVLVIKVVTDILMGFKIWCQVGELHQWKLKSLWGSGFFEFWVQK